MVTFITLNKDEMIVTQVESEKSSQIGKSVDSEIGEFIPTQVQSDQSGTRDPLELPHPVLAQVHVLHWWTIPEELKEHNFIYHMRFTKPGKLYLL